MENKHTEIYQEEQDSTFTHFGKKYNLNSLLQISKHKPIISVKVVSLKWILNHTHIDLARVNNADLSKPILICVNELGDIVIDGAHRLAKAVENGIESIPAKYVNEKEISTCIIN